MRIAFIIDHFYSDQAGTENQLSKLIRGLSSRFDVELIVFRESEWIKHEAHLPCPARTYAIDKFTRVYTYVNLLRLTRYLRQRRIDVVHTFFPVANIIGVLCARLAGVPIVVTSRRDYGEWMKARYLHVTRIANWFVTGIVANSHEVKRLTERVEKFPGTRIEVIYNGIAVDAFGRVKDPDGVRRTLGIPPTNKVVGLVANYRPMKRHETFVRAIEVIVRVRSDVSFLLIGKNAVAGDPKRQIEQMVHTLGLSRYVHFVHAAGNVADYLELLDVGVNCSEGEGLSNAIMEYMAARVPVVVAASGGNPDLVTDGVHGYTFTLGDHQMLAEKILRLLDDSAARMAMTAQAHAKICREMSLEAMLDHFARYYSALVRGRQPRDPEVV